MVSRMFEFFFKYSRATYERAELVFASGWPVWLLFALVAAAAVVVGITIWRRRVGPRRRSRHGARRAADGARRRACSCSRGGRRS